MKALLAVHLVLAACAAPKPVLAPDHDAPTPIEHHEAPDDEAPLLVKLEAGDRACYVTLHTQAGDVTKPGDFELCPAGAYDATPMIGKRIKLATKRDKVQAASCEGNPDCGDSDTVDLVVAIVPAQ